MDYKQEVINSVEKEYLEYRKIESVKTPEVVFDNSYQNLFYITLYDYFRSEENGLKPKHYKVLCNESGNILGNLWFDFLNNSDYSFRRWDDIYTQIDNYVDYKAHLHCNGPVM